MPKVLFYIIVLFVEMFFVARIQSANFYLLPEIVIRSTYILLISFIISAALLNLKANFIEEVIEKFERLISKIGFYRQEQRKIGIRAALALTILINLGIHGYISVKPSVTAGYLKQHAADQATIARLALINTSNYRAISKELNVFIAYKNIKKIQKLAVERMENQKDIFETAVQLSKSYSGKTDSNGFDILIGKLYDLNRQDLIYRIYKYIIKLNTGSAEFIDGSALSTVLKAIDKKEFLKEISNDNSAPAFCVKIAKKKLKTK